MTANIAELIYAQTRLSPAAPAIITHERVVTYGQLRVAIGSVARHLRQSGIQPGQVVGVAMGQNLMHVVTLVALAQVGAVSLPLHPAVPNDRRVLAARRFGASCVVSGRKDMALDGLSFVSLATLSLDGFSTQPDEDVVAVDDHTPFRIAISSGTSGDPKGMVISHRLINSRSQRADPGFTTASRVIPMDLSFVAGFGPAIRTLVTGACIVLPRSMGAESMLHATVSHAVTHMTLSPAQARGITEQFATPGIRCASLVCLRIGGGPITQPQLVAIRERLTPNVYVSYGSTEGGTITWATPEMLESHPASVGKVCGWLQAEVVDETDQPLPRGSIGRLRVRSEDQVAGYYQDDERNKVHFRNGWFYPGDLAGFDEEGLLYIEGRVDDQLNIGGLKLNPEDVDAVLSSCNGVSDAGAFLLADGESGEMLAAAVALSSGITIADIHKHALAQLGPLAPKQYFVLPSLPRTITGKLRRNELTAQFSKPEESQ